VRHVLWCAALVSAASLPALLPFIPSWQLAVLPARQELPTAREAVLPQSSAAIAPSDAATDAPVAALTADQAIDLIAGPSAVAPSEAASRPNVPTEALPRVRANVGPAAGRSVFKSSPIPSLLIVWISGALLTLAPWLLGLAARRRLRNQSSRRLSEGWRRIVLEHGSEALGCATVLESPHAVVPMTWGVLSPVVVVPGNVSWSDEQRRAALRHELAHIARRDTLWQGIARAAVALYWFNPLAWLAARRLRAESELACDDAVLLGGVRASVYAQQLLDVAREHSSSRLPAAAALLMARRSGLTDRLRAVLEDGRERGGSSSAVRRGVAVGTIALAIPLAAFTPVSEPVSVTAPTAATQPVAQTPQGHSSLVMDLPAATTAGGAPAVLIADAVRGSAAPQVAPVAVPDSAAVFSPSVSTLFTLLSPVVDRVARTTLAVSVPQGQGDCLERSKSGAQHTNWISSDGGKKSWTVKWSSGDCRFELEAHGDVGLNAEATDVVTLSPGGSFELEVHEDSHTRRVQIENRGGSLTRRFWVDGDAQEWNSEAATWFAQTLVALDRRTGFAVDQRLPALLKKGGVDAVLSEVSLMSADYAQRRYLSKLFEAQTLSTAQLRQVLDLVGAEMSSDYEKAELLVAISKLRTFSNESHVEFARAAGGIKSAYERRRALTALLTASNLNPPAVKALLAATEGLESDYEMAELLLAVASRYAMNDETRPYYLQALGTLKSDYEHRRVLDAIVKAGRLTPVVTRALLEDAARMKSDYELAEFLIAISASGAIDASTVQAFGAALKSISGDYEMHRVLSSILRAEKAEPGTVEMVLDLSTRLKSDYERASLLVEVANATVVDEKLRPAFDRSAEGIKSEYEYGRAMNALRNNRKRDRM
jgi:beta-lactamase regulating signal transducer with metallopeptidase domain